MNVENLLTSMRTWRGSLVSLFSRVGRLFRVKPEVLLSLAALLISVSTWYYSFIAESHSLVAMSYRNAPFEADIPDEILARGENYTVTIDGHLVLSNGGNRYVAIVRTQMNLSESCRQSGGGMMQIVDPKAISEVIVLKPGEILSVRKSFSYVVYRELHKNVTSLNVCLFFIVTDSKGRAHFSEHYVGKLNFGGASLFSFEPMKLL